MIWIILKTFFHQNIEDIIAHKRIKSSIEGNVRNTALSDKTNIIAGAPLEDTHESKTLRRCKNCHGIGHYAKTCTADG